MNLLYKPLGLELAFEENRINVLAVEEPKLLSELLMALTINAKIQDCLLLSEKDTELSISKKMDVIIDPFQVSTRDKKILNGLYRLLIEDESLDVIEQKAKTNQEIIKLLECLAANSLYPIDYGVDLDLVTLFKVYDVHIADEADNYVEKLLNYIRASHDICGYEVFCIYGLRYYLTSDQLIEFYRTCLYHKLLLLIIEPRYIGKNVYENSWIIDKDKCIIENMN